MADDLDDNWLVDDTVHLASDDDDQHPDHHRHVSPAHALGSNPAASSPPTPIEEPQPDLNAAKKRKRELEKENRAKRRKTSGSNHPGDTPTTNTSTGNDIEEESTGPGRLSPSLAAAYLAQIQRRAWKSLSHVELDDIAIPDSSIVDATAFTAPRQLDSLPHFVHKVVPGLHTRLRKEPSAPGSPIAILVAGAALRVADLVRAARSLRGAKGGEIAKLFAKHMKVSDQASHLRTTKIGLAIGTPDRLGKLLSLGALKTEALEYIILDVTHQDAKQRSLLDIPETRRDVFSTVLGLGGPEKDDENDKDKNVATIRDGIKSGKIKLLLF